MTHPAVIIERKTINLRDKFKKLEKTARKNGHARRVKLYNFIQTRLERFGNWFFTLWSENSAVLRWIKTPEWVTNLHQLKTGTQTTIGDIHGN